MSRNTFEERDNVLGIIERRDEMMDYFTMTGAMKRCPNIDVAMKTSTFISKGEGGEVRTITLDVNGRNKQYAVKKVPNNNYLISYGELPLVIEGKDLMLGMELKYLAEIFGILGSVPEALIIRLNGGNPDKMFRAGDSFYSATLNKKVVCKTKTRTVVAKHFFSPEGSSKTRYATIKSADNFVYPEGSFLCHNEVYSEYAIGLMCSRLEEEGKCINFINILGFSMCSQKPKVDFFGNQTKLFDYTFMELIHGSVRKDLFSHAKYKANPEGVIDSIIIQTYFAISSMQRILGIQHNDLHNDNVMFQDIFKMKAEGYEKTYRGKRLCNADYFSYTIDGKKIYFKNYGFIAKIADFGFAMKYSEPMVGRKDVVDNRYDTIPGWRDDYYDMLFSVSDMFKEYGKNSKLLCNLYAKMLNPYKALSETNVYNSTKKIVSELEDLYFADGRPTFVGLARHPWQYLTDPEIMGPYLVKPTGKFIIRSLGALSKSDYHPNFKGKDSKPLKLFTSNELRKFIKSKDDSVREKYINRFEDRMYRFIDNLDDADSAEEDEIICEILFDIKSYLEKDRIAGPLYEEEFTKEAGLQKMAYRTMNRGLNYLTDKNALEKYYEPDAVREFTALRLKMKAMAQ